MKKNSLAPLSSATITLFFSHLESSVNQNECASIVGLNGREQIYRIKQFIREISDKETVYEIIDLKSTLIEEQENLQRIISPNSSNQKKVYLLMNADCVLDEKLYLLAYLDNAAKSDTPALFIYFFAHNITYPWIMNKIANYGSLFQNIFFYPSYAKNDQKQFLDYLENKFKTKISDDLKERVMNECGGNLWFIKEAVRHWIKNKDETSIFNHDEMIFKLATVYEELQNKEKEVVKKIIKNNSIFNTEEKWIVDYLEKKKFLSPLMRNFLEKKIASETTIFLDRNNKININEVIVDSFFSHHEKKVLRYFLLKQNEVLNREKIAASIWGIDASYTDWALDQFMRRLRNKYKKLGLREDLIKTIKNKGFILTI